MTDTSNQAKVEAAKLRANQYEIHQVTAPIWAIEHNDIRAESNGKKFAIRCNGVDQHGAYWTLEVAEQAIESCKRVDEKMACVWDQVADGTFVFECTGYYLECGAPVDVDDLWDESREALMSTNIRVAVEYRRWISEGKQLSTATEQVKEEVDHYCWILGAPNRARYEELQERAVEAKARDACHTRAYIQWLGMINWEDKELLYALAVAESEE